MADEDMQKELIDLIKHCHARQQIKKAANEVRNGASFIHACIYCEQWRDCVLVFVCYLMR